MAILLDEAEAAHCAEILANERVVVSAVTVAEALIVAERRGSRVVPRAVVRGRRGGREDQGWDDFSFCLRPQPGRFEACGVSDVLTPINLIRNVGRFDCVSAGANIPFQKFTVI